MCDCKGTEVERPKIDLFACEATVKEREAVCSVCDRLLKVVEMCGVCKCLLTVKRRLKAAKCPQGKW